jgi:GntR family transcriptional regulator, transcriptional repressor for pyruvate dehydrogenase complex
MINDPRPPKTAMLIAKRIVQDATRESLRPGDLLPSEHLMLETYSIGRGTLREALRLLEFQGVIALKPGPGGGPVLLDPDPSHLASTLVLLLQIKRAPYRAVVEVRMALEPMISSLAATHITDETLLEIHSSIEDMKKNLQNERVFFQSNRRFHDAIAWSSGNALFGYLVDSLLGIADGPAVGMHYPTSRRKSILRAHEKIYAALCRRDPTESGSSMREHLEAYLRFAEKRHPEVLNRVIPWGSSLGDVAPPASQVLSNHSRELRDTHARAASAGNW